MSEKPIPFSDILKKKPISQGLYSLYYKINNKMGMKLFDENFKTLKALKKSYRYRCAVREKNLLILANLKVNFTPQFYDFCIFKHRSRYRMAIIMQHLGGKTLFNRYEKSEVTIKQSAKIQKRINAQLTQAGIRHGDIHDENIMYYQKRYWVIDFGLAKKA